MSHVGQNRKCLRRRGISVLPPTADIGTPTAQVGFVPETEVKRRALTAVPRAATTFSIRARRAYCLGPIPWSPQSDGAPSTSRTRRCRGGSRSWGRPPSHHYEVRCLESLASSPRVCWLAGGACAP